MEIALVHELQRKQREKVLKNRDSTYNTQNNDVCTIYKLILPSIYAHTSPFR